MAATLLAPASMFADDATALEPVSPTLSGVFDFASKSITLTVTAPTTAAYPNYGTALESLDSLVVYRQCYDSSYTEIEALHPIKTYVAPTPSEEFTLVDTEFDMGNTYSYQAKAFNGEKTSYASYASIFAGIKPGNCTNLRAETGDLGNPPATIYFTTPSVDDQGRELTVPLTKIEVRRAIGWGDKTLVYTLDNPEPGVEYSWVDNSVESGTKYNYGIRACTEYGESYDSSVSVLLGVDSPGRIENLEVAKVDEGVKITWDQPSMGNNGGYVDWSKVVYIVTRFNADNTSEILANDLKVCEYVDSLAGIDTQCKIQYSVQAVDEDGNGAYAVTSSQIVVGPAAQLPYEEYFHTAGQYGWGRYADNLWDMNGWQVSDSPSYYGENWSYNQVPIASEDGCAYAYLSSYSASGDEKILTSGELDLSGVDYPVAHFKYYNVPTGDTKLEFIVRNAAGEETVMATVAQTSEGEAEWIGVDVPLKPFRSQIVNLVFKAIACESPVSFFLDDVIVNGGEAPEIWEFDAEGVHYSISRDDRTRVSVTGYPGEDVNVVIPAKVTYDYDEYDVVEIGNSAFENMPTLASVVIPESVERIGSMAFWGDTALAEVNIPASVKTIDEGAFLYCSGLKKATLAEGLEELGVSAFAYSGLESVVLPESVTTLGNYTFQACHELKSAQLPSAVTSIPYQMFADCDALASVNIPENVNYIGAMAFDGTAIGSVVIPAGVEAIYNSTFRNCKNLEEVELSENLTEIGTQAFNGCESLAKVTFKTVVPPTTEMDAFDGIAEGAIGVCPTEGYEAYAADEALKNLDFLGSSAVGLIGAETGEVEYYTLQGIKIEKPTTGETLIMIRHLPNGKVRSVKTMVK